MGDEYTESLMQGPDVNSFLDKLGEHIKNCANDKIDISERKLESIANAVEGFAIHDLENLLSNLVEKIYADHDANDDPLPLTKKQIRKLEKILESTKINATDHHDGGSHGLFCTCCGAIVVDYRGRNCEHKETCEVAYFINLINKCD